MPFLPPDKKFAGDTHYRDEYSKRKNRVYQQAGPRPTSAFRRNNPHPHPDFLMPKNLVQQDKEQMLRSRVTEAVHQYMDKMIRTGRDPLKEMEQPKRSKAPAFSTYNRAPKVDLLKGFVKPTVKMLEKVRKQDRKQMKRERGNSYKKASKSYGDLPEDVQEEQDEEEEIVIRIPAKTHNPSKAIRYRVVRKPDAPVEQWVSHTGNVPGLTGVKRVHTPPTPPPDSARRPRTAGFAQEKHLRSKSAPLLDKADDAAEQEENEEDWEDVAGENEAKRPVLVKLQRPKTAGPVLARKMLVHPRMKHWIEGATDYEKEVAFNLLKTLNGSEQPPLPDDLRTTNRPSQKQKSIKANRIPQATHIYVPPSPAPRKPVPEREGKMDATTREWMRQVEQKINERSETPIERNYAQKIELRPTVRRQPRPKSLGDYTHENSFFRFSVPSYRRSFVIAPDWVSETLTRRRALKENPSANQLRYGSA
ncbi:uncharacterized protein LOC110985867 isoform X2 [Acanthaster planci]|uniref:Uncharacterized protein LOC110985867 isoform X2 n=1 Tax=Acanthaster planci TaxID=133434 RepID=A0A8B7ZDD9_ACAPL|nr:uncharacterized protein LOC110985867 isoform X2 [Acanthaster planci]